MAQVAFILLSLMALISALGVVFSKNAVHSVLYLILVFFAVAGHYIMLNAQFLAIVHLIVYAGAIMVLFLFVVMLLNLNKDNEPQKTSLAKISTVVAGGLFLLTLLSAAKGFGYFDGRHELHPEIGSVKGLGNLLFNDFVLPFELSAVLFISAMVGAVILTRKEEN